MNNSEKSGKKLVIYCGELPRCRCFAAQILGNSSFFYQHVAASQLLPKKQKKTRCAFGSLFGKCSTRLLQFVRNDTYFLAKSLKL